MNKSKNEKAEENLAWGIAAFIVFLGIGAVIFLFFLASNLGAHMNDKGYRVCMNVIQSQEKNSYGYAKEVITACAEKYLEVDIETENQ